MLEKLLLSVKLLFAISIIVALATYDLNDPCFNVASTNITNNLLGHYGSFIADILFQLLGYASFIIPITLIATSIVNFYLNRSLTVLYITSLILLLASCCGALGDTKSLLLPSSAGGALGQYIKSLISNYYNIPVRISFAVASVLLFILNTNLWLLALLKIKNYLKSGPDKSSKLFSKKNLDSNKIINRPTRKRETPKVREEENAKEAEEDFIKPSCDLLTYHSNKTTIKLESKQQIEENKYLLGQVLKDFGIKGDIIDVRQGPVVTLYELEPAAGTKASRIIGLSDDIARSLSALSTRIAVIPGRNVLGIEIPNKQRNFFGLRELLESQEYQEQDLNLPIVLGKDIAGKPYIIELNKLPHLLVAGTTGSGKSVAINIMILSLLYKYKPEQCRFIMIDPKMLELSVYDEIPHLLTPVVTDPKKAVTALKWAVKEMENRYRLMSNVGVRNITGYNAKVQEALKKDSKLYRSAQTGFNSATGQPIYESIEIETETLPFIVIIVDEMADLMLVAGKDIELYIQRLAQMARAAGIHLIMATQRPSVDVITGVIKANFPSRVSFKVTSKIDSRTILGDVGAEQLLGMGDMLYMGNGAKILRVHCPFVNDQEVESVVNHLKAQGQPQYITETIEAESDDEVFEGEAGDSDDVLYKKAVEIVKKDRKPSISYVQRSLRIGYNRAAILIERMEKEGVLSPPNVSGKREIL